MLSVKAIDIIILIGNEATIFSLFLCYSKSNNKSIESNQIKSCYLHVEFYVRQFQEFILQPNKIDYYGMEIKTLTYFYSFLAHNKLKVNELHAHHKRRKRET